MMNMFYPETAICTTPEPVPITPTRQNHSRQDLPDRQVFVFAEGENFLIRLVIQMKWISKLLTEIHSMYGPETYTRITPDFRQ